MSVRNIANEKRMMIFGRMHKVIRPAIFTCLIAILLLGCRTEVEPLSAENTPTPTATPTQPAPTPSPTGTAALSQTATPTPLPIPTPTPMPRALAHLYNYTVQAGDNLTWILELFGVLRSENRDQILSYYAALNDLSDQNAVLLPGMILQIPVNVHTVASGDTVGGIAALYDLTVPELQNLNPELLSDLNFINEGWVLRVDPEADMREPACDLLLKDVPQSSEGPPMVREITVTSREQLLCLRERFNLSAATLFKAQPEFKNAIVNGDFGEQGQTMIVPSESGAAFLVSADDMTVDYVAGLYGVSVDDVYFWDGTAAAGSSLVQGDNLFMPRVNLNGKLSRGAVPSVAVSAAIAASGASGNVILEAAPPAPDSLYTTMPFGTPPPGAEIPSSQPIWRNAESDGGWCNPQDGFGWTGAPTWPTIGRTINPERGFRESHTALDILGEVGEPIYAAESGVVIWAGETHKSTGYSVVIAHGATWQTIYQHLQSISVACGQVVERGTQIGTMGTAGRTHLHFEIRWQGYAFNPLDYLP
jgi:murein DD-endopeptidase MepM/ murein hydrolase activator NlpD